MGTLLHNRTDLAFISSHFVTNSTQGNGKSTCNTRDDSAEAGCIGICWTNTQPNMPAWGAVDRRIGNNPLVLAIPRKEGHIVVDLAMSQFSYGKLEEYKLNHKLLPVPGGYDAAGNLSADPSEIEKSARVLPIGFWKEGEKVLYPGERTLVTRAENLKLGIR